MSGSSANFLPLISDKSIVFEGDLNQKGRSALSAGKSCLRVKGQVYAETSRV